MAPNAGGQGQREGGTNHCHGHRGSGSQGLLNISMYHQSSQVSVIQNRNSQCSNTLKIISECEWFPCVCVCVQGSSKDIGQLAAALHHRILALKSRAEQEPETQTTTIPETEVPRSNEDDSDEEENASAAASAATPATSQ